MAAFETPKRYLQQEFKNEILRSKSDEVFAVTNFTVSVCYAASIKDATIDTTPIEFQPKETAVKSVPVKPQKAATHSYAPPDRHTRDRSIFYFQRAELMGENEALWNQIQRLSARVEQLKSIVEDHKTNADRRSEAMDEEKLAGNPKKKVDERTKFRYYPPGLGRANRTKQGM
jgi:hypothetical protein